MRFLPFAIATAFATFVAGPVCVSVVVPETFGLTDVSVAVIVDVPGVVVEVIVAT